MLALLLTFGLLGTPGFSQENDSDPYAPAIIATIDFPDIDVVSVGSPVTWNPPGCTSDFPHAGSIDIVVACGELVKLADPDGVVTDFTLVWPSGAWGESYGAEKQLFWGSYPSCPGSSSTPAGMLMTSGDYETADGTNLVYVDQDGDPTNGVQVILTTANALVASENNGIWTLNITEEICDDQNWLRNLKVRAKDCLNRNIWRDVEETGDNEWTVTLLDPNDVGEDVRVTFAIPELATSDPVSPYMWDHASDLVITVTAENGDEETYTLKAVYETASDVKELTMFWFEMGCEGDEDQYIAVPSPTDPFYLTVEVPHDTDLTALVGWFTLNDEFAIMTHSEDPSIPQESGVTPNDYSTPVAFTVFAQDCSTVEYFVNVVPAETEANDVLSMNITGKAVPECCDCYDVPFNLDFALSTTEENTWVVTVPYGAGCCESKSGDYIPEPPLDILCCVNITAFLTDGATADVEFPLECVEIGDT
jgi:hypothetical protein